MRSSLWFLLLGGCASAPPGGAGELGLAGLRRELGLSPVVGHVERSGGDVWLVHDPSGVRLARLPAAPEDLRCGNYEHHPAVAFEGDPGAVVTFAFGEVKAWQTAPNKTCTASTPLFVRADPDWDFITRLEPAELDTDDVADVKTAHVEHASIKVPGSPTPVTIDLTPEAGTVRHGSDSHTLAVVQGDTCGLSFEAMQAPAPDGATWVELSYTVSHRTDLDACEDGIGDAQYESTGRLRVEVSRDGRMRVVETETVPPPMSEELSDVTRNITLPGTNAYLAYQESTRESYGREGPSSFYRWSWTLVVGARQFTLAEFE